MVVSLRFAVTAVRVLDPAPISRASRVSSAVSAWPSPTPSPPALSPFHSHYHYREPRVVPYASRSVPSPSSLHETNCRFRDDDEVSSAGHRRLTIATDADALPGSRRWTRRSGTTSSSRPGVRSRTRRRTATATATCARASGSSSCSCSSRTTWARTGWPRGFSSTSIPAFSSTSEYRYRPVRSSSCGGGRTFAPTETVAAGALGNLLAEGKSDARR